MGETLTSAPDIYSDNLSRDLLRITLSDEDQNQVIDNLSRLIVTHKDSRPTAFWTLGKAKGELAFAPLLALIQATGKQLNNESAYQACSALQRWVDANVIGESERLEQLSLQDPTPLLKRWSDSRDERLGEVAANLLESLN